MREAVLWFCGAVVCSYLGFTWASLLTRTSSSQSCNANGNVTNGPISLPSNDFYPLRVARFDKHTLVLLTYYCSAMKCMQRCQIYFEICCICSSVMVYA